MNEVIANPPSGFRDSFSEDDQDRKLSSRGSRSRSSSRESVKTEEQSRVDDIEPIPIERRSLSGHNVEAVNDNDKEILSRKSSSSSVSTVEDVRKESKVVKDIPNHDFRPTSANQEQVKMIPVKPTTKSSVRASMVFSIDSYSARYETKTIKYFMNSIKFGKHF